MEVAFTPDSVASAIKNARKPFETRDAVIQYFQEKYPGQKKLKNGQIRYEWKTKLVDARMALEPGAKRASISRQFQKDTKTGKMRYEASKPSPAEKQKYKALSDMLPKEYHVRGTICVKWSPGFCEARKIDLTLSGENAKRLSSDFDIWAIYDAYDLNGGEPCQEDDRENPRRPGQTIPGCNPSLFVSVQFANSEGAQS